MWQIRSLLLGHELRSVLSFVLWCAPAALAGAFWVLLSGGTSKSAILVAAMVVLGLSSYVRTRATPAFIFNFVAMISCGLLGWLIGLRLDAGPFGLVILESWCSSSIQTGFVAALYQVQLFPYAHSGMLVGGVLGMSLAMWLTEQSRPLFCCVVGAFVMPLCILMGNMLALRVSDFAGFTLFAMLATMLFSMLPACLFLHAVSVQKECLPLRVLHR